MYGVRRQTRANLPMRYVFSVVRLAPLRMPIAAAPCASWIRAIAAATRAIASWHGNGLKPCGDDGSRRSAVVRRSGCAPWRYRFTPFGHSIPRLNGNSSHGSKPITVLSRTFNCTPHCWPQKQQCVFTSRSGSALVESHRPAAGDRCGPKRSMMCSSSVGIVATVLQTSDFRLQTFCMPCPALRQPEQRAPAARADLLVVRGAAFRIHLVRETELTLDGDQIADHDRRRVRPAAPAAARLLGSRARILVERDADLRRALEDVKQLTER